MFRDSSLLYRGRRIVDIQHIFIQIQNSNNHTPGLGCTFMNVEYINEICMGFETRWYFKCKMCHMVTTITSESQDLSSIPINKAAVNGTIAIGIGYTQLAELSASLDIPCMSATTFTNYSNVLATYISDSAWDAMKAAGIEEKRLALEAGDVDVDGTPMCPVIADGQWSKRSYKTKYDALSGAVCIPRYLYYNLFKLCRCK